MNNQAPTLSIISDGLDFFYDAISFSRLESLILTPLSGDQLERAQTVINLWRASRISKNNYAREFAGDLPDRYVLVTDAALNVASDLSDIASLNNMLLAALDENPDCIVVLFVQGKALNKYNSAYFDQKIIKDNPRVQLLVQDVHPVRLIETAEAIYTVTSYIGFEGLLWGKSVRTFGTSFYSGWGLTEDQNESSTVGKSIILKTLVYAILIEYYSFIDPETKAYCEVERLLEWIGLQRRMRERFPACIYALGFSFHKKPVVRDYFQGSEVRFCNNSAEIPEHATVAYWSRKYETDVIHSKGCNIIRIEDGFIRSIGLGADLIRPISWVMDRQGIYFDATQSSDLENLLLTSDFNESLLHRAQFIRKQLVTHALTKYNVGSASWQLPETLSSNNLTEASQKKRLILVPGQVESDASISYGASGIKRNLDLLKAVRDANPDAYVIYKPHPDVVAGLRYSGQDEDNAENCCDEVVIDVTMGELLPQIDEVHTITSLTGFEALLRGKKVVCYGQPFYSGWGLTEDIIPASRRVRNLSFDELVAGVMILYPAYVSRSTGKFTTPERALEELLIWRDQKSNSLSIWQKILRKYLQWTKSS